MESSIVRHGLVTEYTHNLSTLFYNLLIGNATYTKFPCVISLISGVCIVSFVVDKMLASIT